MSVCTASLMARPPMSHRNAPKGRGRAKDGAIDTELPGLDWDQDRGQPRAHIQQWHQSPRPGEGFCADKPGQVHQMGHVRGMECGARGHRHRSGEPTVYPHQKED